MTRTVKKDTHVTIRDVAREALVSIGTVSRVLNNHPNVEPDLRLRVLKASKDLGYLHKSRAGGSLEFNNDKGERKVIRIDFCCRSDIGPFTPLMQNPYFSVVLQGVEVECRRRKLHLLYRVMHDKAEELPHAIEMLKESKADAVLLVNFVSQELIGGLMELGLPAVMVDQYFPDMPLDVVMNENYNAAIRAVQHLIEMGHTRIGFLDGLPHYTIQRRREGYRAALEKAGIGYNPDLILSGNLHMSSGHKAAEEIVKRKLDCTAYFCANDTSAIGLIQGLRAHNIRVPEDVSIIGFDDIEAAKLITPALTTIQSNAEQLGRLAVIRLLERVKDPTLPITQTLLQSSLILRDSVRRL